MIEVDITFNYGLTSRVDVPLFLTTLAPEMPVGAKTPTLGRWFCTSVYLGSTYGGNYYVKEVKVNCSLDREERWVNPCRLPGQPIAFFFDTRDDPFLILEAFGSMRYRQDSGYGTAPGNNYFPDFIVWKRKETS